MNIQLINVIIIGEGNEQKVHFTVKLLWLPFTSLAIKGILKRHIYIRKRSSFVKLVFGQQLIHYIFLDLVLEQFPFPIQRIQTDKGLEFFAEKVQLKMMELDIKFRPNKLASPHLNVKVERSQKTDLEEFYAITDLSDFKHLVKSRTMAIFL